MNICLQNAMNNHPYMTAILLLIGLYWLWKIVTIPLAIHEINESIKGINKSLKDVSGKF